PALGRRRNAGRCSGWELSRQVRDDGVELVDDHRQMSLAGTAGQPRAGGGGSQPFPVAVRRHRVLVAVPDRHGDAGVEGDTPVVDEGQVVVAPSVDTARYRLAEGLGQVVPIDLVQHSDIYGRDQITESKGPRGGV